VTDNIIIILIRNLAAGEYVSQWLGADTIVFKQHLHYNRRKTKAMSRCEGGSKFLASEDTRCPVSVTSKF